MFYFFRYFLNALEAALSMMFSTGSEPFFVRYVMFYLNVSIVELSIKYFTGVANISFDKRSYSTKIALFPSIYLIGDFRVKSTYTVPFFGFRVAWYAKR